MRIKTIALLLLIVSILTSCKKDNPDSYFIISGSLSNLENGELRFEYTHSSSFFIDTVAIDKGHFEYKNQSDTLKDITIRISDTSTWFTVWAKNGDVLKITGDVQYPGLIEVSGGEINDHLTKFKNDNKETIRKIQDLKDQLDFNREENLISQSNTDNYTEVIHLEQILKDQALTFIQDNPGSFASLILIQDYVLGRENVSSILPYLKEMDESVKGTALYTQISKIVNNLGRTAEGNPAPDFSVTDIKNDTLSLKSFEGNYLLMTFAENEKDTCISYLDKLKKLYEEDKKFPLNVLTFTLERDTFQWEGFPRGTKSHWHQVIEPMGWKSEIPTIYNVISVSDNYLIDKKGRIIGHNLEPDSIKKIIKN